MVIIEKVRLVNPLDNLSEDVAITSQIIAAKSSRYAFIVLLSNWLKF